MTHTLKVNSRSPQRRTDCCEIDGYGKNPGEQISPVPREKYYSTLGSVDTFNDLKRDRVFGAAGIGDLQSGFTGLLGVDAEVL